MQKEMIAALERGEELDDADFKERFCILVDEFAKEIKS